MTARNALTVVNNQVVEIPAGDAHQLSTGGTGVVAASAADLLSQLGAQPALGYQPARPVSGVSGNLGNTSNVGSAGTILGSVTLTATATTMLLLGDAYFASSGALQNGALYLQVNNSGGSAVATGHQSVQACPASTYTQISAFLVVSGLTVGATYTIYLIGVNSTATNTLAVNNAYVSGVNL